jgi:acyl-coenzyme A synthetase/AMP-(fatty) acid ligase
MLIGRNPTGTRQSSTPHNQNPPLEGSRASRLGPPDEPADQLTRSPGILADMPVPRASSLLPGVRRTSVLATAAVRGGLRARLLPPANPVRAAQLLLVLAHWGTTPAIGWSTGCARHPDALASIDADDDALPGVSFREAERRTAAITTGLVEAGIGAGTSVALLGRTSRSYAEAIAALSRTGADVVYLNTGFSADQLDDVTAREGVGWVLADDDLADRVSDRLRRIGLGGSGGHGRVTPRLSDLTSGPVGWPPVLPRPSRHVILTSGTTGTPRGVARDDAPAEAAIAMLAALPYRPRETHVLAAPLFHAWGWLNHRICPLYDTTEVFVRRAEGARVLRLAAEHRADAIVATPVLLRRMLEVPVTQRRRLDLTALRVVAVSGARLPPDLVVAFTAAFGDVLHNLYGSTEAAFATCASPDDLRADPSTAGRPLPGVRVEVLDDTGRPCRPGVEGRVHVGSRTSFAGYTDGSDRARSHGLVSTGDIGAWDGSGRLTVLGRADDVIISGGENVHPEEVERVLRGHPEVADVGVVGTADEVFGQAVRAYVVRRAPEAGDAAPAARATSARTASDDDWAADLQAWAATRLAPYQRPRDVLVRAGLPHNETGKLVRRLLA